MQQKEGNETRKMDKFSRRGEREKCVMFPFFASFQDWLTNNCQKARRVFPSSSALCYNCNYEEEEYEEEEEIYTKDKWM